MTNFEKQFEEVDLKLHGVRLPEFIPEKDDKERFNLEGSKSNREVIEKLCLLGLKKRLGLGEIEKDLEQEYLKRIDSELAVFEKTNFIDYVLIVWDMLNFARKNDIAVGYGRGSCGGSCVIYLLEITDVCPIKYNLVFERFLSETRTKSTIIDGVTYIDGKLALDIDCDFSDSERYRVVEYLQNKYSGKFCKISTYSTFQSRVLMKDVAKIVGNKSEQETLEVSRSVPSVFGKVYDLKKAYKESADFKKFCDENPKIYKIALKLYGLIKGKSSHASAYILSYYKLDDFIPVEMSPNEEEAISAWDMNDVQIIAIKLDLLGLQSASLVHNICKSVGITRKDIPLNSYEEIYSHLQTLKNPYGLFQISGDAAIKALHKMQPKNLVELSNVISICRPGSIDFIDDYVAGVKPTNNQQILDILKETRGIVIYQESLLRIGRDVFGLTGTEAEELRRGVGKKKIEEVSKWINKVKENAVKLNIPQEDVDFYVKVLNDSASYSFNASHGFLYCSLSAACVYLKFKYPQQFFLESLKIAKNKVDFTEEFNLIQRELPDFGIKLLPPSVVYSDLDFKIEGKDLRFGLSEIKGIADKGIGKLKAFIGTDKPNKFALFEAAKQVKLNIGVLSALIQSGALTDCGENRVKSVLEAQVWFLLTPKERTYCLKNGHKFNFELIDMLQEETFLNWTDDNGKKLTKLSRLNTIRKNSANYFSIYRQNSEYYGLANYWYEKQLLGFSHSSSLKDVFSHEYEGLRNSKELEDFCAVGDYVQVVAECKEVKEGMSKAGNKYVKLTLTDELGQFSAMMVGRSFEKHQKWGKPMAQEGDIVLVKATKAEDIFWINEMDVQNHKIFMKLADLKNFQAKEQK